MDFKFEFDIKKLLWGEVELLQEEEKLKMSQMRGIIARMVTSVDGQSLSTGEANEAIKNLTMEEADGVIESFRAAVKKVTDDAVSPPTAGS